MRCAWANIPIFLSLLISLSLSLQFVGRQNKPVRDVYVCVCVCLCGLPPQIIFEQTKGYCAQGAANKSIIEALALITECIHH